MSPLGKLMIEAIVERVKKVKYHSLILDLIPSLSNQEHLPVVQAVRPKRGLICISTLVAFCMTPQGEVYMIHFRALRHTK